jgi:integrase
MLPGMDQIERFLTENTARIRTDSSRRHYRIRLRQVEAKLGPLPEVTGQELAGMLTSSTWSPGTVKTMKTVLAAYYRWAIRAGLVTTDPTVWLDDVKPANVGTRRHTWLEPGQVRAVLDACPHDLTGRRDRALLFVGMYTGLRNTEITELLWSEVDLDRHVLHVLGKGGKHADVGLAQELVQELTKWRALVPDAKYVIPAIRSRWASEGQEGDLWVEDRQITSQAVRKAVRRSGERAGISCLRPHDLRRSLAGMLDARGVPLDQIQRVLRHSSVATTQRYLADNPAKAVDLMQSFEL